MSRPKPDTKVCVDAVQALDIAIDTYLTCGGDIDDVIKALDYRLRTLRTGRCHVKTSSDVANDRS